MKNNLKNLAVICAVSSLPVNSYASDSHYVAGLEGIKSSSLPPPGLYYKGFFVNYTADKNENLPPNSKVTVNAIAHKVAWVTSQKVLGADLLFESVLPMVITDIKVGGNNIDKQTGIGDFYIGSALGWHGDKWDVSAGAAYWFDTGKYDETEPASPGKGHDSVMLTLGGNLKLNQTGDISLSVLGRYEIPDGSNLNDEIIIEWGLAKSYGPLDVGLVGYKTLETGKGKEKRNAMGLSLGNFWPEMMLGANIAVYKEFSNEETFEGTTIRASLTKVF
jgi:hypothetical protein